MIERYIYSDVAIETALIVKGLCNLSLRALEEFTNSVRACECATDLPSNIGITKRATTVKIEYRVPSHILRHLLS